MIVVSDTSPINYLTLVGHQDLLAALFGEIAVPTSVLDELSHAAAPIEVKRFLSARPRWLRIIEPTVSSVAGLEHLDRGERDAILLGIALPADLLLIDEAKGRQAARSQGLKVIGTIGILDRAIRQGLVDGPEVAAKLRVSSFRATPKMLSLLHRSVPGRMME